MQQVIALYQIVSSGGKEKIQKSYFNRIRGSVLFLLFFFNIHLNGDGKVSIAKLI